MPDQTSVLPATTSDFFRSVNFQYVYAIILKLLISGKYGIRFADTVFCFGEKIPRPRVNDRVILYSETFMIPLLSLGILKNGSFRW